MELVCDYRSLQSLLNRPESAPVSVVVEKGMVLGVLDSSEDLSEWIGVSLDSFKKAQKHREFVVLEKDILDAWIQDGAANQINLFEQFASLRAKEKIFQGVEHFLFGMVSGRWSKVLPSSFGMVFRLTGTQSESEVFLAFRNQKLIAYFEPKRVLGSEDSSDLLEKSNALASRYLMPVQSVRMTDEQWNALASTSRPWKLLFSWILRRKISLSPFRWQVMALIFVRAWFG